MLKPLKTSLGGSAEGKDKFFKREKVIQRILEKIDDGDHLIIAAPRRIGKTSILKYIRDNPPQGYIVKYLIVQSLDSIESFNKHLFEELIKDKKIHSGIGGYLKRKGSSVEKYISRVRGVSTKGVQLSEDENIDYWEELNDLFEDLKSHEKKIVIFIDEYPDTVLNIKKRENESEAIKLLQQQREILERFKNTQIQFVYTGSTGLKNVVRKLGDIHLINNLTEVKIPPLTSKEAKELIQRLILGKQKYLKAFDISDEVIDYALTKMQWLLPYFIQVIVEALYLQQDDFDTDEAPLPTISKQTIDEIFTSLVKSSSEHAQDYFEHWKRRLNVLEDNDLDLTIEALNITSAKGTISYPEYYDLTVKHKVDDHRHVLEMLLYDGYLAEDADKEIYGFNSVLLKEWWANNVAK